MVGIPCPPHPTIGGALETTVGAIAVGVAVGVALAVAVAVEVAVAVAVAVAVGVGVSVAVAVGVAVAVAVEVAVAVAVAVLVAVAVAVPVEVAVAVGVEVAVWVAVGVGVAGGLTPKPVMKSKCVPPFRFLPFSPFAEPLSLTAYLVSIARRFEGVKIAVSPSQAMVPAMRAEWPAGPNTRKDFWLIV